MDQTADLNDTKTMYLLGETSLLFSLRSIVNTYTSVYIGR